MSTDAIILPLLAASTEGSDSFLYLSDKVTGCLNYLALFINVVGVGILIWGVTSGLFLFIKTEAVSLTGEVHEDERERLRHHLGYYILLGLEVLIAADIIHSIAQPSWMGLVILGGVVVIRTVISVSLNWELDKDKRNRLALMSKHENTTQKPVAAPAEPSTD